MLDNFEIKDKKATRDGFGKAMLDLGHKNDKVIAMCADLTGSLKLNAFEKEFPNRFIQAGISEANMIGMAAGLATTGKIPFATTFANFATGRVYDQIRQSVAYSHKNVKICASHAGLTLGEDGATHQILEDLGMMKMLPGMTVINPCDYNQVISATHAIAEIDGPVYLRFGRPSWPVFMPEDNFEIGKAIMMQPGSDVSIIATGHMVYHAMEAVKILKSAHSINAELINIHTIKPLDNDAILSSATKTGAVVTAEEHQRNGGLGDSVAQVLSQFLPTPQEYVAVNDSFGESGTPAQLLDKYGLGIQDIVDAAVKAFERKS